MFGVLAGPEAKAVVVFRRKSKHLQPGPLEQEDVLHRDDLAFHPGDFGDLDDPNSEVRKILGANYSFRRKPELGTQPNVYYILGGSEHA